MGLTFPETCHLHVAPNLPTPLQNKENKQDRIRLMDTEDLLKVARWEWGRKWVKKVKG